MLDEIFGLVQKGESYRKAGKIDVGIFAMPYDEGLVSILLLPDRFEAEDIKFEV